MASRIYLDLETLERDYARGASLADLAERNSVSVSTVLDRLRARGVAIRPAHRRSIPSTIQKRITTLTKQGLTQRAIAQRLQIHRSTVYRYTRNE